MSVIISRWLFVVLCLVGVISEVRADERELPAKLQHWLQPQKWVRDSDQPVLSLGKPGEFDDTHIFAPCIQQDGDQLRLWYCGSRGKVSQRVFDLGLAVSRDGRTFEKAEGNPVFRFGDGKHSVLTPTILRDGKQWRMWFAATDFANGNGLHTLHVCTSDDGVRWSAPSAALLSGVYAPTVLKVDGQYRMWFAKVDQEPWVICHATSADGLKWDVTAEPVIRRDKNSWEAGRLFYPTVVHQDGVFLMWYGSYWQAAQPEQKTALGFAVSLDGVKWHKHPDNPVSRPEPKHDWESHYVTSESVLRLPDGSWRMWYASRTKPPFVHKYFAIGSAAWKGPAKEPDRAQVPNLFRIEHSVILTSPKDLHFAQSRAALVPGSPPRVLLTTQQIEKVGSHGYRDVFAVETNDSGKTWSPLESIETLKRKRMPEGHDLVIGDVCPQWHAATGVVLATGKTFGFDGGTKENRGFERVSYATYSPATKRWSDLKLLALPQTDHEGHEILEPNAGCHQRFDLPNGEILLPIRYRKDPKTRHYTTIVARCTFDGETLAYREHGSEFTISRERGLYEPSVIGFHGRYFLTMRADHSAFVARGQDGLNYEPFIEWTFDDGQVLGSYNAQQHWVAHDDALYLIYTRRGANNDHVFRHRAPLFIARVDLDRLCVLRETEQILMPETGLDLAGGFGVTDVSPSETWIVSSEMGFPKERREESNRVLLAKIYWASPK